MATPVLAALRRHYGGDVMITAMGQHKVLGLLHCDPHIDALMGFTPVNGWIHRRSHRDIISPIQKGEYDLGILLTNSFSSAWCFWRGGVERRIGFKGNWRSWLLTDPVSWPENTERQHLVLTYQALLAPLDIKASSEAPHLYLLDEEKAAARLLLERCGWQPDHHCLIGINPGAAYGSAKCWLPERFVAVAQRLLGHPEAFLVFFGDGGTASLVQSISEQLPQERVLNLAAKTTLREFMAIISLCRAILTNDSGPMHIAAALKTPLLALFGSTSAVKTGPYGAGVCRIIQKKVACSPCYRKVCPIDFRCMRRIEVEEVYEVLCELAGLA